MSKDIGFLKISSAQTLPDVYRISVCDKRSGVSCEFDIPYPTPLDEDLAFAIICDIVAHRSMIGESDSLSIVSSMANGLHGKSNETLGTRIFLSIAYSKLVGTMGLNEADMWYLQNILKQEHHNV